jgi:hypothetical protein
MACEVGSRFAECGGLPERVGNNTDFNLGGLELARTNTMKQAIRVLEHATRISIRVVSNSTSSTTITGRLAHELEGYVKRLKRIENQDRPEEFFRVLGNAQMKLIRLVCSLRR